MCVKRQTYFCLDPWSLRLNPPCSLALPNILTQAHTTVSPLSLAIETSPNGILDLAFAVTTAASADSDPSPSSLDALAASPSVSLSTI